MAAIPYAHIVATLLRKKHPKGTDIALAPNPKDIVWYLNTDLWIHTEFSVDMGKFQQVNFRTHRQ